MLRDKWKETLNTDRICISLFLNCDTFSSVFKFILKEK
jgi:hypothetical protein